MTYYKMNSSGNDFVFFVAGDENDSLNADFSELAVQICDRHKGIGADGLVAIFKGSSDNHIIWDFYNCDGSRAHMCGNASRAAAFFACEQGLVSKDKTIFLHTLAGIIEAQVSKILNIENNENSTLADLARTAYFGRTAVVAVKLSQPKKLSETFNKNGFTWYFFDTGVPHLVTFIDDLNSADMELARSLRHEYNANVNFCEIRGSEIFIRTFERGVESETQACGTGMCAAALAYREKEPIASGVRTTLRPLSGEIIRVYLQGKNVNFEGQVNLVFKTEF